MELNLIGDRLFDPRKKLVVNYSKSCGTIIDPNVNTGIGRIDCYDELLKDKKNSAFREMAIFFGQHSNIDKVDFSEKAKVRFEGSDKILEVTDYGDDWFIINYLIDCYDKNRGLFFDANKDISRFVIIPSTESSYKIFEEKNSDGKSINWMVIRIGISGVTAIHDSEFLKYLVKELFKDVKNIPDKIKLVCSKIDEIDVNSLNMYEVDDKIVVYDPILYKYFFKGYKDNLEKRSANIDEDINMKRYGTMKSGGNDGNK